MLSPLLIASTDADREVAMMTIEGPFGDPRHAESLRSALPMLPSGYRFVIDLSGAWGWSEASLAGLRGIARDARDHGQQVVFVCADVSRRAELILADLDGLAPVVESLAHAIPLTTAA